MSEYEEFVAALARLGEAHVKANLAQGLWATKRKSWAEAWLKGREAKQNAGNQAAIIGAAEGANEIARSTLRVAQSAKNAAWVAAWAAIIAAVFAALAYVFARP